MKIHLHTKHRSTYDELFASNSETQSSLETFVRSAEVKKVPSHSTRTVQQQLADTYWVNKQLTFACRFTALVKTFIQAGDTYTCIFYF